MSGPPPVPGGRSEEERERARRERAARRSGIQPVTAAARTESPRKVRQPRKLREPKPAREPKARAPRRPREPRPPRAPRTPRPPGSANVRARILLALLAVGLLFALWFAVSLFQPFHGDGEGKVAVAIPRNSGLGEISDVLEQKGVISSGFFFQARARLDGKSSDLKPGTYTLKRDMSYGAVLDTLSEGPPENVVTLIVPEGKSRREIAPSIKSLEGDYLAATKRSDLLNPARYGAENARDLEGFLFPASYQLKPGQSVDALVEKQLQTFKQRFDSVDLTTAKRKNLTPYDVLIIASLVERETAEPNERGLIASVIYNRLSEGIPLGIDATTRFQYNDWENPLRQSQLASPSPYNTRLNQGLPPGPIGNPGVESIEAAASPEKSDYLYYVANPCEPGTHTFVKTSAEFEAAVAKYNAAREAAGGKAPKGC